MKSSSLFSAAAAFTLATLSAKAAVLISNFNGSGDDLLVNLTGMNGSRAAAGFTLPAGNDYTLDSVTMRLQVLGANQTLTLSLYSDVGGNPGGSPLTTLTSSALTLGTRSYVFTPTTAVTLEDSMTYWFATSSPSGPPFAVNWVGSNPAITATGIATSEGYRFGFGGVPPTTALGAGQRPTYAVNGTAVTSVVPEPGTALFGLALVGVVLRRRR